MKTVLLDLDGVLIRRYQKRPQMANWQALANIFQLLTVHGSCQIICITDRPAGQLPYFCWVLHGGRFHFGELGATCFDRDENRVILHPEMRAFAETTRPELIEVLRRSCHLDTPDGPAEEPGGKRVTISMERPQKDPDGSFAKRVQAALAPWRSLITFDLEGSAVSVYPRGLTKLTALLWACELYQFQPQEAIWVADGKRDIALAERLREMGGTVGSVGNGHPDFQRVAQIVVAGEYEEGLYQILRRFLA